MGLYALVEDDTVTSVGDLPKNWRNVSGLNLASTSELKEKGWLPYSLTVVELGTYEAKDGLKYTINADDVVGVEQKRDMTDDEKTAKDLEIATQYQRDRLNLYGRWEEQLDMMYHSMDDWKAHVKAVKDKYPKPE
jgi:hypothetical protein